MRIFVRVCFVSLLLSAAAGAQVGHCDCVCKQGTSKCVPSFPNQCGNACSLSACGPDQVDFAKTRWSNGACSATIVPGTYETLVGHVQWAVGHQGAGIWTGKGNNLIVTGEQLRASLLGAAGNSDVQHYKDVAQAVYEIKNAKVDVLEAATTDAVNRCIGAFNEDAAFPNFQWVAKVQGQIWRMDTCRKAGNYDCIRSTFSNAESHRDEFRNNLYCYSGEMIDRLMARLGPVPVQPPPTPRNPHPANEGRPDKPEKPDKP